MLSFTKPGLVLAGAVLLSGCATVGPDFQTPAAPAVTTYAAPGEGAPARVAVGEALAQDWWTLFRSPELDSVVRLAAANSPTIEAARARLDQARQTVLAQPTQLQTELTAGAQREKINLAGFGFQGFPGLDLKNPTVNLYSVGASVRYDLDLWGSHRREGETRLARAQAAEEELNAAYLTLTGQVVTQALAMASAKAQIAAAEDLAVQDRALIDLAQRAVSGGSGTRIDIAQAEAQLAADESVVPALRQQLAVSRHALTVLVGKLPAEWTPPDFQLDHIALPQTLPVSLPSELARRRPDIRASEARLHAATAQIGVARAQMYPDITLSGNFTQSALDPGKLLSSDFTGYAIGPLAIRAPPIFNRSLVRAQVRGAEDAARAAAADYRQVVLQAFGQVADVLQAVQHDDESFAAQSRAVSAAQESLRLNRLRYEGGKAGLLPVIDAQRSYQRARMSYVRAQTQRYLGAAQLMLATGGGWTPAAAAPAGR